MWFAVKRLLPGLGLIAAACALLLATDVRRAGAGGVPAIAVVQHASLAALDDGVRGVVDGLARKGYRNGETANITLYNAQGDMATANAIAREICDGRFKLVATTSTLSLQTVANANRSGRVVQVFGLVADPYVAGVGLDPAHPLAHPRWLVGQGLMFPVGDAFRIARRMLPGLKTIGVAWDPSQANSRRFVEDARAVCRERGLTLVEAQVENTAGVREAIQSVIGRGAQVVWVGGDVMVASVIDTVIATAREAGIPVFSQLPGPPERMTIFEIGFDFYDAGRLEGELAGEILQGTDPATIPIREAADLVARRLTINRKAFRGLKEPWRVPDDLLREADTVVDDKGVHAKAGHGGGKAGKP
jgi:ABC-type uncharacterized transport system substrate-binding protein